MQKVAHRGRPPAVPIAPEHPLLVALARYPEHASKYASSLQPLSQANLRDLPLLLRGFLQFGVVVIFQPSPQSIQNRFRRFPGSAYDENSVEAALVFTISFCQRDLCRMAGIRDSSLLLLGPRSGLKRRQFQCFRFTNASMAAKCLQPVRFS